MPEPGMGNAPEQDGYGGRDGGRDPYGSGRNTPWGPQDFWSGVKSGGLLGGLLGAINDPSLSKTISSPGENGYDTRDGGGGGRGLGGGRLGRGGLSALLRQIAGNTQQPFPMYQMPQNYMPQITPMNPGTPGNVNELYAMYGATPGTSMPGGPSVPQTDAPFGMSPALSQFIPRRTGG